MTLDLDELTAEWDCPPGELRGRVVIGRDGQELLQLRVDLGVMQMFTEGRPDGERYHGLPSARAYIEHELCVGNEGLGAAEWQELERELLQLNYRRMAFAAVADTALEAGQEQDARRHIERAVRDIEDCLAGLELMKQQNPKPEEYPLLEPTLVFDRSRLAAQLHIVEGRFEESIEQSEAGAESLDKLLTELGYDEEQRTDDPGVRYLRGLGKQLRREYGIARTLHEQLLEAIENEDFEGAAEIRDELRKRQRHLPCLDEPAAE